MALVTNEELYSITVDAYGLTSELERAARATDRVGDAAGRATQKFHGFERSSQMLARDTLGTIRSMDALMRSSGSLSDKVGMLGYDFSQLSESLGKVGGRWAGFLMMVGNLAPWIAIATAIGAVAMAIFSVGKETEEAARKAKEAKAGTTVLSPGYIPPVTLTAGQLAGITGARALTRAFTPAETIALAQQVKYQKDLNEQLAEAQQLVRGAFPEAVFDQAAESADKARGRVKDLKDELQGYVDYLQRTGPAISAETLIMPTSEQIAKAAALGKEGGEIPVPRFADEMAKIMEQQQDMMAAFPEARSFIEALFPPDQAQEMIANMSMAEMALAQFGATWASTAQQMAGAALTTAMDRAIGASVRYVAATEKQRQAQRALQLTTGQAVQAAVRDILKGVAMKSAGEGVYELGMGIAASIFAPAQAGKWFAASAVHLGLAASLGAAAAAIPAVSKTLPSESTASIAPSGPGATGQGEAGRPIIINVNVDPSADPAYAGRVIDQNLNRARREGARV